MASGTQDCVAEGSPYLLFAETDVDFMTIWGDITQATHYLS